MEHAPLDCRSCHTAPVTMESTASIRTCTECHVDHHAAERSCVQCHRSESREFVAVHGPPNEGHRGCTECHDAETVTHLVPDVQFCETCHTVDDDHPPLANRACTVCHFLETPEQYRRHLVRVSGDL
jgi:hypothetical protein